MNTKKLFDAAKTAEFEVFEAIIASQSELQIEAFNDVIENYQVADSSSISVRGVIDGKVGSFSSDRTDDGVIDVAVNAVKESAKYGQAIDLDLFIKPSDYEYEKVNNYHDELANVPADKYIDIVKSIAKHVLAADKRIESVNTQLGYAETKSEFYNSNGLNLSDKNNYVMIYASIKAVEGEHIESGFHYALLDTVENFDVKAFAETAVKNTVSRLGGESVETGKYNVVFSPECVTSLIRPILSGFSAFNAEQHLSLLEGKMGTNVFSPLLTITQTPIGSDPFCSAFDAEGVPCHNSVLIDKGVPTGYVYDLATAKRAGVKSTGNGHRAGAVVRPGVSYVTVESGDLTLEKLFEKVGDGIYVDSVGGTSTGINGQSGEYALQAEGYLISGGKIVRPVSLITIAGNIMTDFANIIALGNDQKLTYSAMKTPSIAISGISVSGLNQ